MGTLKCACSYLSRDNQLEHTLLRVPIGEIISFLLYKDKTACNVDTFSTTYLPHLVNVVKERPQMGKKELKKASNLSAYLQKIMEISFFSKRGYFYDFIDFLP